MMELRVIRVLSVRWPWIDFLASGVKQAENRERLFGSNLVGHIIGFHASKQISWEAFQLEHVRKALMDATSLPDHVKNSTARYLALNWRNGAVMKRILEDRHIFPDCLGKIVALAKFAEIWEPGVNKLQGAQRIWRADDQYGFYFTGVYKLCGQVPATGMLGFWKYPTVRFLGADQPKVQEAIAHNERMSA